MTEITPEPQNATPENLRKLARLIEMGQPLQAKAASEAIILCVSAWEDACRRADGWQRQAEECAAGIVLAVIRQHDAESRSEELEKELQELKDAIDGKTHLRDAARAAEENP